MQRSLELIRTTEENGAREGDDEVVCQSGPKYGERFRLQAYSQAVKLDALHEDCKITFLDAYKRQNANKRGFHNIITITESNIKTK